MKILIRADGSLKIGLGHIFRCVTIAKKFKELSPKSEIYFVTNSDPKIKNDLLKDYVCLNPLKDQDKLEDMIKSSDVFISDLLDTSNLYISQIKMLNPQIKVVCIDNNTNLKRIKSADIVFNANVFNRSNFVESGTNYYLGTKYMILREEFEHLREKRDVTKSQNVFISFGGSDEKGCTLKTLESLKNFKEELIFLVVIGPLFSFSKDLERIADLDKRIKIFKEPSNIYDLMGQASLAITAAGITLYELSTLGVPSIVIPQVDHQKIIAEAFAESGSCVNLGDKPSVQDISDNLRRLLLNESIRKALHKNSMKFVDGNGLKRFTKIILDDLNDSKI